MVDEFESPIKIKISSKRPDTSEIQRYDNWVNAHGRTVQYPRYRYCKPCKMYLKPRRTNYLSEWDRRCLLCGERF